MKAPKSNLTDNDMWDPLVIRSNLFSSHPPHRAQDAKGDESSRRIRAAPAWWGRGRAGVAHRRICPAVEVGGGGREHGSGDRRWREMDEAAPVPCGEVMVVGALLECCL